MPYATQPNVTVSTGWQTIASGATDVTVQVVGGWPAIVFVGSAAPSASSMDGHRVEKEITLTGLTTETVYARASAADRSSTLAVTRN